MPKAGNIFFVRSTRVRPDEVLRLDDRSLWDSCDRYFGRIDQLCGDGASRLFAEPNVKAQEDGQALNIAWFASYNDEPRELEVLDRARHARVTEDLARRIDALRPALADPEVGEAVAAMLNVYDHRSIVAVGEHAVLTNWGAVPETATTSQGNFAKHSATTVGPFLKAGISPRLPGKQWAVSGRDELPSPARPAAQVEQATKNAAPTPSIVPSNRRISKFLIWPPAVMAGTFGMILAYAAWPGNLVYERRMPVSENELGAAADINRGLKQRIGQLTGQLGKNACQVDRSLIGLPQNSLNPSAPTLGGQTNPNRPTDRPRAGTQTAPPPAGIQGSGARASGQQLLATLDASTLLVVVPTAGGRSTGTGFFVSPTDILTNRHVVDDRDGKVYVASKALGKIMEASVVAQSTDSDADFALLRVPAQQNVTPLPLAGSVNRLDDIVTGGFPAFVMETDSVYQNIVRGDPSGLRSLELVTTRGYVISMPHDGDLTRIAHSAEISEGNSGGPLIDACGRAVGINTYVRRSREIVRTVNYSLGAADMQRFMAANGVQVPITADSCQPPAVSAPPPPPTAATPPPAAGTTPAAPGSVVR